MLAPVSKRFQLTESSLSDMKSSRGFTLIELLVVIAIIGILMALLFPAVGGALDAAKKAQAKNDVTQIATAIIAFQTEYGRLPVTTESATPVDANLVNILTGVNTTENPRKIVFIETQAWKKGKGGTNTSGAWLDGWGNPYKFIADANYDNTLSSAGESSLISANNLRKQVAVWNNSTNGKNDSEKKRRAVASWE